MKSLTQIHECVPLGFNLKNAESKRKKTGLNNWSPCLLKASALCAFFLLHNCFAFPQNSQPNIVVIICDDLVYNTYSFAGGSSFMLAPNIKSIADDGAEFKNFFCTYALCTPSRGTMLTGLYPHNNGAYHGKGNIHSYLPTVAGILSANGYQTAMIGKYQMDITPQPGWDYWLCLPDDAVYEDPIVNFNGVTKDISGLTTDIITDSAVSLIESSTSPFFLWIAHQAPHTPFWPPSQDSGIFDNEVILPAANAAPFTTDYPSFIYAPGSHSVYDFPQEAINQLYKYYDCAFKLDQSIQQIINALIDKGILDNTLLIFTSDNGRFFGQHQLTNKRLPYDDAMRLPAYIRYPAWFAPHTVIDNNIGLNLDIAPTIIDAAGIPDTFGFQGTSLRNIADGTVQRNAFMFEYIPDSTNHELPSVRSVRSIAYQYNRYRCSSDTIEEFFDMVNDPLQEHNSIFEPDFASLIDQYRTKLDSFQIALVDTLSGDSMQNDCYLVTNVPTGINEITLQTNISSEYINLQIFTSPYSKTEIRIYNLLGEFVYGKIIPAGNTVFMNQQVNISSLASGYYLAVTISDKGYDSFSFVKN